KSFGSWTLSFNMVGPPGEAGDGFTPRGQWTSGDKTYTMNDCVTAPSSADDLINSLWIFYNSVDAVNSTTAPKDDLTNWVELPAIAGPAGENGNQGQAFIVDSSDVTLTDAFIAQVETNNPSASLIDPFVLAPILNDTRTATSNNST